MHKILSKIKEEYARWVEKALKTNGTYSAIYTNRARGVQLTYDTIAENFKNNHVIPKYRKLTELSNEEITEIITDIFNPEGGITSISRNEEHQIISVTIRWNWGEGDKVEQIEDDIELSDGWCETPIYNHDIEIKLEEIFKWQQFLIAKGICPWLKDNPYLE